MDKTESNNNAAHVDTFPELVIKTTTGQSFEIPLEGSLGLLALGDIGLIAWRQKKLTVIQEQQVKIASSDAG